MKICLVSSFPPSGRQLNEYALYLASELQRHPFVDLTILADELSDSKFVTDGNGHGIKSACKEELPGFKVLRAWKFNNISTPQRLLRAVQTIKPDVVWYNLLFSTFATQEHPVPAFAGLCVPALTRALGHYSHVTLHHIIEHVDFSGTGIRHEKVFRLAVISPLGCCCGPIPFRSCFPDTVVPCWKNIRRRMSFSALMASSPTARLHRTFLDAAIPTAFWPSGIGAPTSGWKLSWQHFRRSCSKCPMHG